MPRIWNGEEPDSYESESKHRIKVPPRRKSVAGASNSGGQESLPGPKRSPVEVDDRQKSKVSKQDTQIKSIDKENYYRDGVDELSGTPPDSGQRRLPSSESEEDEDNLEYPGRIRFRQLRTTREEREKRSALRLAERRKADLLQAKLGPDVVVKGRENLLLPDPVQLKQKKTSALEKSMSSMAQGKKRSAPEQRTTTGRKQVQHPLQSQPNERPNKRGPRTEEKQSTEKTEKTQMKLPVVRELKERIMTRSQMRNVIEAENSEEQLGFEDDFRRGIMLTNQVAASSSTHDSQHFSTGSSNSQKTATGSSMQRPLSPARPSRPAPPKFARIEVKLTLERVQGTFRGGFRKYSVMWILGSNKRICERGLEYSLRSGRPGPFPTISSRFYVENENMTTEKGDTLHLHLDINSDDWFKEDKIPVCSADIDLEGIVRSMGRNKQKNVTESIRFDNSSVAMMKIELERCSERSILRDEVKEEIQRERASNEWDRSSRKGRRRSRSASAHGRKPRKAVSMDGEDDGNRRGVRFNPRREYSRAPEAHESVGVSEDNFDPDKSVASMGSTKRSRSTSRGSRSQR